MAENTGEFRWDMLGKPDYSQAAAIVASLPKEVKDEFVGREDSVLTKILFLCWTYVSHSGRGTAYCIPSQATLGRGVSRTARTVQRYLTHLRELGLVQWRRRSPRAGMYQSCLYSLGKRTLAVLYARASKKLLPFRGTTFLSHNDLKKGNIRRGANEEASPSRVILTGKSKPAPFSTAQVAFAQIKEEENAKLPITFSPALSEAIAARLAQ